MSQRIVWLAGFALSLVSVLLFCFSTTAFADDGSGVKSISQSGVITAGGFPYKITQAGSYRLASNLIVPANTDAIDITADNVTLDLNGFTIAGPVTCNNHPVNTCSGGNSGVGVYSGSNDNVAVRNGSVNGMGIAGVSLGGGGASSLVEDVHVKFNGKGIAVNGGIVRHCIAVSNLGAGITGGVAILEGNFAAANGDAGLSLQDGTAIGNSAVANRFGLLIGGSFSAGVLYGSNSLISNLGGDLVNDSNLGVSLSQNNNYCSTGPRPC